MTSDKLREAQQRLAKGDAAKKFRAKRGLAEAVWYVSRDGESSQGPYVGSAVIEMHARGELPGEFLLWRDGMEDWLAVDGAERLRSVIEGALGAGGDAPAAATPGDAVQGMSLSMPFQTAPEPEEPPARERVGVSSETARPEADAGRAEDVLALIPQVSSQVIAHMNEIHARVGDQLTSPTAEQQQRYLAFELGALEFHRRNTLRAASDSEEEANQAFFALLVNHANEHYPKDSEAVITVWHSLQSENALLDARELGFRSIADGLTGDGRAKPGHYPADYLRDALGLPRTD